MKLLKILLIALVFVVNLTIARPVFANHLEQNPDYMTLTETLTTLTQARDTGKAPEGMTLADVDRRIGELQYQKYIMQTGEDTICRNETSQPIAVYGPKSKKSTATFDQVIYLLPPGEETDDDWTCSGMYLPNDGKVAGLDLNSAAAIKILEGTELVMTENPDTGAIELNLPPAGVFGSGDVNWEIPDLTQADLTTQFPTAPLD